jgi:spore coat protein CotH
MRLRRAACLSPLTPLLVFALVASAQAAGDPAGSLYRPETINVIKLELPQSSIDALKADPEGEYQPATFSFAETDGTPSGVGEFSTPLDVSVRLKGSGSFLPLGQKAGFKIKFAKKATFRGLRKMTLNSMVQDTSMLHEVLSYRAMRTLGVPGSRTSFADLIVNGEDYGVHLNIENLDKVALEKRYGTFQEPPQHLYEGEYGADATPAAADLLEVDEGEEDDRSDLNALVAAANGKAGEQWYEAVSQHADLKEMTRMWLAEKYLGHADGYAGEDAPMQPNNYYLYSDAAGRFQMLPWGMDQNLVYRRPFEGSAGSLFDGCISGATCRAIYRQAAEEALEAIPPLDLSTAGRCIAERLQPWQEQEPQVMQPHSGAEIAAAVSEARDYVASRPGELAAAFKLPAPPSQPLGTCPPYGSGEEVANPSLNSAEAMYEPGNVSVINLTLPEKSVEELNDEPDEYVEGTISLAETNGTPAQIGSFSTPLTIGIRLKGGPGSSRTLAQKAAFKLKLNWVKGQTFRGLKKMTLNNMVQDPSMIHEALAYDAFHAAGVDAPHAGYAYVYVNGVDYGLHLNLETLDDVAAEKRVGPFQHLYEGADGSDVETGAGDTPEEVSAAAAGFEVDEGDDEDLGDLEALVREVNEPASGDWSDRVETVADLKQMTRMWAVEKYIGHWDGYAGQEGASWPNNFYLLSSAAGWFRMLPWGVDQTWSSHLGFDGDAGVLFDRCLADSSCAEMYRRSLRDLKARIAGGRLDSLATATATLLKPWQELEQGNAGRHEYDLGQIEAAVQATKNFIAARPAELDSWLSAQPALIPASQIDLVLEPSSIVADGVATTTATATVRDDDGNPIPGDEVTFSSSDPDERLGQVVDNDDGTYSVQITASTSAGAKTITAGDDSVPGLSDEATLTERPGPASQIKVVLQPNSIVADGLATTSATATVRDANGNLVAGDQLTFSSSDPAVQFGSVTDNGDGTYSAQITASTSAGAKTITVSDAAVGGLKGSATLTQRPGAAASMTLMPQVSSIAANGVASTIATATVRDANGNPVTGEQVVFSSSDPGQGIAALGSAGGNYSARITASTSSGAKTITATDISVEGVQASAIVTQTPGPAAKLSLSLQPTSIVADGASATTATAVLSDAYGNPVPGQPLVFSSSDPEQRIGSPSESPDGGYEAGITASGNPGSKTITVADAAKPNLVATAILTQTPAPEVLVPMPSPAAVKIFSRPRRRSFDRTPTFRFGSSDATTEAFRCRLDRHHFRSCVSPLTLPRLSRGRHRFQVQAVSSLGALGPLNSYTFVVAVKPRRSKSSKGHTHSSARRTRVPRG